MGIARDNKPFWSDQLVVRENDDDREADEEEVSRRDADDEEALVVSNGLSEHEQESVADESDSDADSYTGFEIESGDYDRYIDDEQGLDEMLEAADKMLESTDKLLESAKRSSRLVDDIFEKKWGPEKWQRHKEARANNPNSIEYARILGEMPPNDVSYEEWRSDWKKRLDRQQEKVWGCRLVRNTAEPVEGRPHYHYIYNTPPDEPKDEEPLDDAFFDSL